MNARGLPFRPWAYIAAVALGAGIAAALLDILRWGGALWNDWRWYALALPRLTSDAPLYEPWLLEAHRVPVPGAPPVFEQFPTTGLLGFVFALPFSPLIWGVAMTACLVFGLRIIWPRGMGPIYSTLLAAVLIAWLPVTSAFLWANVNSVVFLLLAIALRHPRHAGWAIGAGIAVKLLPVLMLPWLLRKQGWRSVAIALGVLAVAMIVVVALEGPSVIIDFIRVRAGQTAPNHPLRWGLVPLGLAAVAGYALASGLAILSFVYGSFTLGVAAMLIGLPVPHVHYYIWLLVPLMGVWGEARLEQFRCKTRVCALGQTPRWHW